MVNNGVETEVKYWNFLLSVMDDYTETEDTEIKILPFLSILNDKDGNAKGNSRIISLLQKLNPSLKTLGTEYYSEFLQNKKEEVYEIIENELAKIDFNEITLFGITAKYNQWLPGMILAEEIKKIAPNVKIIVGGFGNSQVAQEAMKLCQYFDFTTWGEGEYPLLHLAEQLKKVTPDLKSTPRIIYRENGKITQSKNIKSEYLDFDNYIYPDYDDYANNHPDFKENDQISIPINTIRACHWGKCKFCDFNKGYKLRIRSPECIVNEIEHLTNKYGITTFSFVDSDTFGNLAHFEELLNRIINLKYKNEEDYLFWAEIIPKAQFNSKIMEKMAIAGFKSLFIGYDGLSDSLLTKMNKSNSFSDNIFFVKDSIKNGINPLINVIQHVPDETEEDVQECTNNLHFLRFFYNNKLIPFMHTYVSLVLSSMTKYYTSMDSDERAKYNQDDYSYLLPDYFSCNENRFHLFRYEKNIHNNIKEWDKLIETEAYYKANIFSYKMLQNNGIYYYTEYCNDEEIASIVFSEPEYVSILKTTQTRVFTLTDLHTELKKEYPNISLDRLIEIIGNLKSSYLIYCNAEFSNVVPLIEIKN